MTFQPFLAAAAARTMPAISLASMRSSEIRDSRSYSSASACRPARLLSRSKTRAYVSHAYAKVSRFRFWMSSSHSFPRVWRRPMAARLQLWKMCATSWTTKSAKGYSFGEVLRRDEAGRIDTKPDDVGCIVAE